jgi:energy-converting hydrogenase Eha subunit F
MDHPQTPRILAPNLQSFQHKLVRILGKVVQLRGETAVIDAGGNIDVILNRVRLNTFLRSSLGGLSFLVVIWRERSRRVFGKQIRYWMERRGTTRAK